MTDEGPQGGECAVWSDRHPELQDRAEGWLVFPTESVLSLIGKSCHFQMGPVPMIPVDLSSMVLFQLCLYPHEIADI